MPLLLVLLGSFRAFTRGAARSKGAPGARAGGATELSLLLPPRTPARCTIHYLMDDPYTHTCKTN